MADLDTDTAIEMQNLVPPESGGTADAPAGPSAATRAKRSGTVMPEDLEDDFDIQGFKDELKLNEIMLSTREGSVTSLDAKDGARSRQASLHMVPEDAAGLELQGDEKEEYEEFQREKVEQEAMKEMAAEMHTKGPQAVIASLEETFSPPCDWHWTRWVWLVCFAASLVFVILGANEDNTALDYVFSITFIVVSFLALWLVYDYYTNWRIACSIYDLWRIGVAWKLIVKMFQFLNKQLNVTVERLTKTRTELVNREEKFNGINERLGGQVKSFKESQELLQKNLIESSRLCQLSLKVLRMQRKTVESHINEESAQLLEDAKYMFRLLFNHCSSKRKLDRAGYEKMTKMMAESIENVFDLVRILEVGEDDLNIPTWEELAGRNKEGEIRKNLLFRMFIPKMISKFVEPLLEKALTVKQAELKEEERNLRKAAGVMRPIYKAFLKRVEARKKAHAKAMKRHPKTSKGK
mmetsp:Transcript_690/g.1217  ORF Transcript_690/g.1217 Transcript_690/m.1217 type:complete len:466 (+) Transcript_690:137-1534(+)|eukprot:CAMPEP_0197527106 /NCGR_PEP_ID=MMETSP1318-20131121/20326_1 /TAXON_ID=552666 /ORGANISM="Partenskyella glossopodia, Strain RCC365" /LENGTH=465 /DNA_ID=CAMNT_0043081575 /DNA_START=102 /DNA_END=1499 /DNA_ORIENTATION=+